MFNAGKAVTEFMKDPLGKLSEMLGGVMERLMPQFGQDLFSKAAGEFPRMLGDALKDYLKSLVGGDEKRTWDAGDGSKFDISRIGGYASGTASALPGLAWVGEEGPELVRFRGGERVWSAAESRSITQQAPGQTLVRVELVDERLRGLIRAEYRQMRREGALA